MERCRSSKYSLGRLIEEIKMEASSFASLGQENMIRLSLKGSDRTAYPTQKKYT